MTEDGVIECVPNFSDGRDPAVLRSLELAAGSALLDATSDPDHNRSVLTLAARPAQIEHAAFSTIEAAARLIDVSRHSGVHPRTGAADVVPFIPVRGDTLANCAAIAHQLGERIWRELQIPVYFYEAAALRPECARLENIRRNISTLTPDLGRNPHPTAGVCIVGARKFPIAWNIELRTTDLAAAREVAAAIRESSGGFPALKALGLRLPQRNRVQVSMNLVDFERTALHTVFDRVAQLCDARGIEVEGSELIGLIPQAALNRSAGHDLRWLNLTPARVLENALRKLQ